MKKMYIAIAIGLLLVCGAAAAYWWLELREPPVPAYVPKDLTGIVVPPVTFPLKDSTFIVPNTDQSVVLNLVSPSARRDYPLGRYTIDGQQFSLVAYDDFVTEEYNEQRAVPISVTDSDGAIQFYLAVLEVTEGAVRHRTSLPLGTNIRVRSVSAAGSEVTVSYLVHDREQQFSELPTVSTEAVFDIATETVLQVGRNPKTEIVLEYKQFAGEYIWQQTADADTVVVPNAPNAFGLRFDANRIQLTTDCNSGTATFETATLPETTFTVGAIAATKMFCESAQEADYFAMVGQIASYAEIDNSLVFTLADGREMTFVPKQRALEFES